MDIKKALLITLIILAILGSVSVVSAGWFDFNEDNADVKTHEFNYANMVTFNLSDELTNNTEVKDIFFGDGVSYKTPENDKGEYSIVGFEGVNYDLGDPVERNKNDALYKDIGKNQTSQGYDAYIFKWAQSEMYEVYIDLDNMTIIGPDDYEAQYHYFKGTVTSLEEANIFIETFKVNEDAIDVGV